MGLRLNPDLEAACIRLATTSVRAPAPRPMFGSEKEFQAWVIGYAKERGWRAYHTHDSRRSVAGFPDLVLVRNGILLVAELKFADGKPSAEQRVWLDEFRRVSNALVFLWYETDAAEIQEVLR